MIQLDVRSFWDGFACGCLAMLLLGTAFMRLAFYLDAKPSRSKS
jgi:hypothetical protein